MNLSTYKIEKDLELLCIGMIDILNVMKERGIISPEVYEEHTKSKVEFLNSYSGKHEKDMEQK